MQYWQAICRIHRVILTKLNMREGVPCQHRRALSWLWKSGLKFTKIVKICKFSYKSAIKGPVPLSNFFYKIWRGEGVTGLHPHAKLHRYGFKNIGLQPPKLVIFGINFFQRDISH